MQAYSKDSTNVSYTYDSSGMRLSKTVNNIQYTYQYNGGKLMHETRGSRILDYFYDSNGQAIAVRYKNNNNTAGTYYYYAYNSRGDIVGLYDESGSLECTYTYDAWGNILSVKNPVGMEMTSDAYIGNLQSLKYRGYYYDYETGFYYLQSRYYDPVTHRFINADGLISAGTGILGYNMFAYVLNCPNSLSDSCGYRPIESTTVCNEIKPNRTISCKHQANALAETHRVSMYGSAPTYRAFAPSDGDRCTNPNCYSYAIGEYSQSYDPGDFSSSFTNLTVDSVGEAVIADFNKLNRGIRQIDSYNSPVYYNEYRIALRVSDCFIYQNADGSLGIDWDYHFMVQTSNGAWAEKHGPGGATVIHYSGNPSTLSWDRGSLLGYYSSDILYFAITN